MTMIKTVNGMIMTSTDMLPRPRRIDVRVTVDEKGKTLSLSDGMNVLLGVPLEGLENLIRSGWEEDNHADRQ